ncbi:Polymerase/histidinol phosphatase-like protein [Mycena crocata]|nr:Polymerase/histidinol phosphatase-like protein [Mycena crocata]
MPFSLHSHSGQFCKHAVGSLEEVVLEAVSQGFQVYRLTEHVPRYRTVDLYPEEESLTLGELARQFERFLVKAHRLKLKYSAEIHLLLGEILQKHRGRVEYIVGSVHHVNGIPIDFDLPTFQKAVDNADSTEPAAKNGSFLSAYFDAQYELLQRFKPEVVGHIDLCRLCTPTLKISDYPEAWERVKRNILYAIEYGVLFEVNAPALRKGWSTPYPGEDLLEIIVKHQGRLTLSDDSHGLHAVGLNYGRVPEYLQRAGVADMWYLDYSETPNPGGRNMGATKMDQHWDRHPFWTQFS